MDLARLPSELLDNITSYLDIPTSRSSRLVNKGWNIHATKHLSHTVVLTPTTKVIASCQNILGSKHLRQTPRRAVMNNYPIPNFDPRFYSSGDPETALVSRWHLQAIKYPRYEFTEDQKEQWEQHIQFNNALNDLVMMPNLKDMELHFTANCGWRIHKHDGEYEAVEYRESLLQRSFKALK